VVLTQAGDDDVGRARLLRLGAATGDLTLMEIAKRPPDADIVLMGYPKLREEADMSDCLPSRWDREVFPADPSRRGMFSAWSWFSPVGWSVAAETARKKCRRRLAETWMMRSGYWRRLQPVWSGIHPERTLFGLF
jgi:hypothetical protein